MTMRFTEKEDHLVRLARATFRGAENRFRWRRAARSFSGRWTQDRRGLLSSGLLPTTVGLTTASIALQLRDGDQCSSSRQLAVSRRVAPPTRLKIVGSRVRVGSSAAAVVAETTAGHLCVRQWCASPSL